MIPTIPGSPQSAGLLRGNPEQAGGGAVAANQPHTLPKIGIALSGGGARGLAHVGVLQVLAEEGLPVTAIAGTSMGAYVGSLFAAGYDGAELERLAREIKDRRALLKLLDPLFFPSAGLIRGDKIRRHLDRSLAGRSFEELAIPLLVVATDLESLTAHVFSSGPVAPAVHASAAIPGICAPVHLNGHRFTDGGAAEPMPVTLLKERFHLDAVVAVNVLPTAEDIRHCQDVAFSRPPSRPGLFARLFHPVNLLAHGNVLDTFRRALMCAQVRLVEKEARCADVVIHPFDCKSSWFDFENFDHYIALGRNAATEALPAIRALLSSPNPPNNQSSHETSLCQAGVGCIAA